MAEAQYTQYYIAFLDILGFKNLVNDPERTCQDILNVYEFVGERHKDFFTGEDENVRNSVKMRIMSDSICLYVEANTRNALHLLMAYCVAFQHDLLIMSPSIFVRGGISLGGMYVKEDIIFGPALTDAYLLEEKNAKVPRIIIRKKTLDYGMSTVDEDLQEVMSPCIFRDEDAFYALDYLVLLAVGRDVEAINRVKGVISNQLDTTIDESIRQKYLYVEKRMRKYLKEKPNA